MKWRYIGYNPMQHVMQPRAPEREYQNYIVLSPDDAAELIWAARGTQLACLIVLAVTLGLRRGELLALRWADINLDAKKLQVRHNVVYIDIDHKTSHHEGAPGSASGKRVLALPDIVVESLRAQRARQLEARLKAGSRWIERDLVFTSSRHPGEFMTPTLLYYQFRKILNAALLKPMRWHELRHSAATILLSMGRSYKKFQGMPISRRL